MTSVLVEAVKELKTEKDAEIDALKAENDTLKARLDALEAK
jgi:cell division protein FtsB